jgi:hypothetical protein
MHPKRHARPACSSRPARSNPRKPASHLGGVSSADRWIGNAKIHVRIDHEVSFRPPHRPLYHCTVSVGNRRYRVDVGGPTVSEHSIDSPAAFDETARAAISFGSEERDWIREATEWAIETVGKADQLRVTRRAPSRSR